MNSREFFYLVAQMRQAQREYFNDRTQARLRRCKALEAEVDGEILRVKDIVSQREESRLDSGSGNVNT